MPPRVLLPIVTLSVAAALSTLPHPPSLCVTEPALSP
jgi:hypothetical protein